jgi:flavin reductase (DIM6/NTAB) family NADH-FMN oxidoreductase RutF
MAACPALHRPQIDSQELRRALGSFPTGIGIVTTRDTEGTPRGMTANSFTSVSLDPPLLLVCVSKAASSFPAFGSCNAFAVNLLHERQQDISSLFASKIADKFAEIDHDIVHTGAPVLDDCLAWFDCSVHERVDAGDHMVLFGRVEAFATTGLKPLAFCRGRYAQLSDPQPALRAVNIR